MRSVILFILSFLLGSPGCMAADQGAAPATLKLKACRVPGAGSARCATYRVPEDRGTEGGRTLDLNIVVLPAREERHAPDPILFFHGGPGAGATSLAPLFERSRWRDRRDIVLIDQRGTGESGPLDCPLESLDDLLDELASFGVPRVKDCRERLDANLSLYTTSIAVEDLEEIRGALGAPQVNLIGGSYGTRVALVYMRRYPKSVRTATLRGVAPPTFSLPSTFDADSMRALEGVLADCAADARCRAAFPDLRAELDRVVERLEREPGATRIRADGKMTTVTVTRELFVASLHYSLYVSDTAARIPLWIHEAHRGDFEGLVESALRFASAISPQMSLGAFLSVVCAEDVPFYDPAEVAAGARGTLLRGRFSVTLSEICDLWPVEPVSAAFKEPVRSEVPTLLISGDADPVTPPRVAEEAAQHLKHSLHLVLPETGHLELTPGCVVGLVDRFIESGTVEGLDRSCVDSIRRPRFELD